MKTIYATLLVLAGFSGCATTGQTTGSVTLDPRLKCFPTGESIDCKVDQPKITFNTELRPASSDRQRCAYVQTGAEYLDCFGITPR
ncbi:MAG: hypothetical protein AABX04_05355 [Nanoarchaeota archaeon]